MAELQANAAELVGRPVELASPTEVSDVLFKQLQLPRPPGTASLKRGGGYSTKVG